MTSAKQLSRRERQIMDALYQAGEATAADVRAALADAPSYSAIRALLRILEEKGHITHREEGARYVYLPTQPRQSAARLALQQVVETFFGGSVEWAVATLLSADEAQLTPQDADRLRRLIEQSTETTDAGEDEKP